MVCREERKGTSVPPPERTGVLPAGAESLTALGATESAPPQRATVTEPLRSAARAGGLPPAPAVRGGLRQSRNAALNFS